MSNDLEILKQHHEALLLAEAIGWLHDYRKCSEEQLKAQSANATGQGIARAELVNHFPALTTAALTISSMTERLPDLLNDWHGQATSVNASLLRQYLSRCHNTAHFDKQDPTDSGKQTYPGSKISTAFGFEMDVGSSLASRLWALPWSSLIGYNPQIRETVLEATHALFTTACADTRRPINEINLWDWGLLVGALYKAALAAVVLGHQQNTQDLRWRLLGIRTDALTYLTSVSRLPDLVARQNTLQAAMNNVQSILETEFALATEVYRDENGALYVIPDLKDLLALKDDNDRTLLSHIQKQFAADGEVVPEIVLDPTAWWGQDPDRSGNDEIPPAGAMIARPSIWRSDPAIINETWESNTQELCPICGLRPCVSRQIDYCEVCGGRRKGRVRRWVETPTSTIWLDEVADSHGRLALIAGAFGLTDWLNGVLVESLLVKEPEVTGGPVVKSPSFARLRRIWQTTQTFWQKAQTNTDQTLSDSRRRLKIGLANNPGLTAYHTYELDLRGLAQMSVLWDGAHLISIDNLSYTAAQLGIGAEKRRTPADAALAVGVWLEANKGRIWRLTADDEKQRRFDMQIADVDFQDVAYATTISILAQPRTFMTLVPADKALAVVQTIKVRYEREMGKVRNRLPLHLGIVYAERRTPLRAILDTGRRMLAQKTLEPVGEWRVVANVQQQAGPLPEGAQPLAEGTQQFQKLFAVQLEQPTSGCSLTWYIPAVMGDCQTEDAWYPYIFLVAANEPTDRNRRFQAPNPWTGGNGWLVHAGELKTGDTVYFTPAALDFEFLDTSARRFEIAYDEQGRRRGRPTRPYLLEELTALDDAWEAIAGPNGLTNSQIHALRDLIEDKRAAWQPTPADCAGDDGMFWQFCRGAILTAQWPQGCRPAGEALRRLVGWAARGLLTDAIELRMGIMKESAQRSASEKESTNE